MSVLKVKNHRQVAAHNFAAVLPGDSVVGLVVANGISNFLNLYKTLLVVRLVLTWFPNSPPAIVAPLRSFPTTRCFAYRNYQPLYNSEEMVDEAPGQQQQHHEELRRCQLGLHCILLQYRVPNTNLPASPLFVLYLAEIEENFCLA
ncbi:unnamed protein product [Malus baccata var. baccata]